MRLLSELQLELLGVIKIKKDRQVIYSKKDNCKPKGASTSCKISIVNALELNQEGDV